MVKVFIVTLLVFSMGCASIGRSQKAEIADWKADETYQEIKKPELAAGLNLVIGIGDFYNGNIGLGIGNLLLWPLSVLWAPVGGYDGALLANWEETKIYRARLKREKKSC